MTLDPQRVAEARLSLRLQTPPAVTLPNAPPDLDALYKGAPFAWNSPFLDCRAWALQVETKSLPPHLVALLELLRENPTADDVNEAAECAELYELDDELSTDVQWACCQIAQRLRYVGAFMGHYVCTCMASHAVSVAAAGQHDDAILILMLTTVAVLREVGHRQVADVYDPTKDADIAKPRDQVVADMERDAGVVEFWRALRREDARAAKGAVRDDTGHDPRGADFDRAERVVADLLDEPVAKASTGALVFPKAILDGVGKSENERDVKRLLGESLGAVLPRVEVPADWHAWQEGLIARAPWLAPAIRAVRATQGGRTHWSHGAVYVVGPAGAGKSLISRLIAQASGLPFARVNLDAASDSSVIGGTSIRWSSAHPGPIEALLAKARKASGLLLVDEFEKAAGSRTSGGHPHDLMHGLLEPETARAWRSPYLLGEVDYSHMLYVVTGNSTDGVVSSLLDRMTVIRVSEPGPEHLGLLAPALARQACRELGLDERWGDLDREELNALQDAWRGGSVRRLQRLVARLLQARDFAPVARH